MNIPEEMVEFEGLDLHGDATSLCIMMKDLNGFALSLDAEERFREDIVTFIDFTNAGWLMPLYLT